jgi:hypothetical protein
VSQGVLTQETASTETWRTWAGKNKLPLACLITALAVLILGLVGTIADAIRTDTPQYFQLLIANDMMVTTGYIAGVGVGARAEVYSIWLLITALVAGGDILWLRRRFSLKWLLLVVIVAAALASLPPALIQSRSATSGSITLSESSFGGQPFRSEAEMAMLLQRLSPQDVFTRMPGRMRSELNLAPSALKSVTASVGSVGAGNAGSRETVLSVEMSPGLSPEQSATLFQFIVAEAYQETEALYLPRMKQGNPASPFFDKNNTRGRFAEFEKEWRQSRTTAK